MQIFHINNYSEYLRELEEPVYAKVADVETTDLGQAYHLTNNIDKAWIENPGVTPVGDQHRSSSVGDVFENNGRYFRVASIGFEEIPRPEIQ